MNKLVLAILEQFDMYLPTKQDKALYKRKSTEMADEIVKLFEKGAQTNESGDGKGNKSKRGNKPNGADDGDSEGTGDI